MSKSYCLEVSGDFACFTRPEMKVERVSYDVMTPSAARAVFEAIVWKPAIRWRVTKIEVLKPIKWISVRRNEVGTVASTRNVQTAMGAGSGNLGSISKKSANNVRDYFSATWPTVSMPTLNSEIPVFTSPISHIFPKFQLIEERKICTRCLITMLPSS